MNNEKVSVMMIQALKPFLSNNAKSAKPFMVMVDEYSWPMRGETVTVFVGVEADKKPQGRI